MHLLLHNCWQLLWQRGYCVAQDNPFWVDSMCIFLAVFVIEITIVSTCCHGFVCDVEHGLQFCIRIE